jgi:hypothetical protein
VRYPKVDPNPQVKVGVVSPTGGKTVWADSIKEDQYFGLPYWKRWKQAAGSMDEPQTEQFKNLGSGSFQRNENLIPE